jgi:hypothetical protein
MRDLFAFNAAATRWWFDTLAAQGQAATTIALRMPELMADPSGHEAQRAISEKVAATMEGIMGAATAALRLPAAMAAGPVAMATAALAVADAAARPSRRRVKANARRLGNRAKI